MFIVVLFSRHMFLKTDFSAKQQHQGKPFILKLNIFFINVEFLYFLWCVKHTIGLHLFSLLCSGITESRCNTPASGVSLSLGRIFAEWTWLLQFQIMKQSHISTEKKTEPWFKTSKFESTSLVDSLQYSSPVSIKDCWGHDCQYVPK